MKKNFLKLITLAGSSVLLLGSCDVISGFLGKESAKELSRIETHNEKLVYEYKEEFVKPGVTAFYSNGKTAEVADLCSFDGFNSSIVGKQDIAVFYTEGGQTRGATYSVTIKDEELVFSSLSIQGEKTSYEFGEQFVKPTVIVTYTNGTTETVTSKCTFTGFNAYEVGNQTITVTYNDNGTNRTLTYNVTVASPTRNVISISIENGTKTEYSINEQFETPKVKATFSDQSTADVSSSVSCTGYDMSTAGEQTVTVNYTYYTGNSVTTTYKINVTESTTKMKFAIFADVQLCNDTLVNNGTDANANFGNTANAPIALKNHLEFCKKQGISTILMNGDVTNQANDYYYQHFNKILKSVYGTDESKYPEFLWNMGNHEWWWGTSEKETGDAVSMFKNYARIDSSNLVKTSNVKYSINNNVNIPSYYKVINGVPFIAISAENSSGLVGSSLETEIKSWLTEIKNLESVKAGGPIFVEYHYPLSTSMTHGQASSQNAKTVENIFKDTPNVVIFTGDTHYPGVSERSINQVDFTTINLGSSSYSRMVDGSAVICDDYYNVDGGSTSSKGDMVRGNASFMQDYTPTIQLVEVSNNNTFTIDRYFTEDGGIGSHVGSQWRFSKINSKSDFTYTNDRFQNVNSAQALYGANGLSWEQSDTVSFGIDEENNRATVSFSDVTDFHSVEHYLIEINSQKFDVVSNYYTNPKEKQNNYYVLDGVQTSTSYNVKVTAYDFFDNPSLNTLTSSVNSNDMCVDNFDNKVNKFKYSDISSRINGFEAASTDSHSSLEYYYKGIQKYNAGATCTRFIDSGKDYDASSLLSYNDSTDTEPVITFKAKATTSADLVVGVSVVTSKWHTDFGSDVQKSLPADGQWHEYSYNLKDLYSITKKADLTMVQIKVKSSAATTNGYEMGVLFDDIDIVNSSGSTPASDRGEMFIGSEGYTKNIERTSKVTVDLKFTTSSQTKVAIAFIDTEKADSWGAYFGYYNIYASTKTGDYEGIEVYQTNDGYLRLVVDATKLTTKSGSPEQINVVYLRENWTSADGLIDVNPTKGEVARGENFLAGTDYTKDIQAQDLTTTLTIDIKFTTDSDTKVAVMLGDGWDNYFGYYDIYSSTKTGDYEGVSVDHLKDGFIRFTFDLSKLDKIVGSPQQVNLVYFRNNWTTASGLVDINSTASEIVAPDRGEAFTAGENFTKDIEAQDLTTSLTLDIKFSTASDTKVSVMLGDGWNNYFGYYSLSSTTKDGDYTGVTVGKLKDGYIRFTFDLSKLNKIEGSPQQVNLVYFRDIWTTASGFVEINSTASEIVAPDRGEAFTAGSDFSKDITAQDLTTTLTLDIKFSTASDTKVSVMLGDGWNNYFGYYALTSATKDGDYNGLTVEKLADDYIRFTFDLSELSKVSGDPQKVNLVYFRGIYTTASGLVDINPSTAN